MTLNNLEPKKRIFFSAF